MKKGPLLLLLGIILAISGCTPVTMVEPVPVSAAVMQPPSKEKLVISAVGDILMHNTELNAAYQAGTGEYDFSPFFTHVRPLFHASDLVIGNLETTLAGKKLGYTGYPRFNTPEVLAANLKEAGLHVLTTANNHSLDRGEAGLLSTISHLDRIGILHTGTSANPEEKEQILLVDKKGIKIAVLAYTSSTNGISLPQGSRAAVNYLEPALIEAQIKKARESGAQLVILALHFGQEYKPYPDTLQKQLARSFLEAGADVILGHHPHVLQPAEIYLPDKPSGLEKKFIIYSLGNFVSDQNGLERKTGIILNLYFEYDPLTRELTFDKGSYVPIWTHKTRRSGNLSFQVLPIDPALTSIKRGALSGFTAADVSSLEKAWTHATEHMKSEQPEIRLQQLSIPLEGLTSITDY